MAPSPSRELRLLANFVFRDRRDPITVVDASLPFHPVPPAAQDRNDLPLDVLLALTQKDDVTGPRLRRRRRLRLGHDQRPSCRRADSLRAFGSSPRSGLARRLREERAHQRAQRSAAALRACDLGLVVLADREADSDLASALVTVVLEIG